jgi:hypothetical integral membrane protein (TIGR02206 family)
MSQQIIMESFTPEWWICITAVISTIVLLLLLPKYVDWAKHANYPKFLGLLLLLNLFIENSYSLFLGSWSIENNLPLHFCGISTFLSVAVLWRFNSTTAHILYYWGMTGGLQGLLTPEFDLGIKGFFYYAYFITHGGLLFACLYSILHQGFKPEKYSWLRVFLITQFAALVVGSFNWSTGSNYMYLSSPPVANNPLIIGDWPWYILVFEGLALAHFFLFYKLSRVWK